jgi:predicted nuclease with TOPRIM domain
LAKRLKHAESSNIELQRRVDELNSALQGASGDNQRLQAELARLRVQVGEVQDKYDALARENKQLTGKNLSCLLTAFHTLL